MGVMAILRDPAPGLGTPDGFSLRIFHSSNVLKSFHTKTPPGGRAEGTRFPSKLSHHNGVKRALSLGEKRKPAPTVGVFPGQSRIFFFLTSLAKCRSCIMIYRAAPSCWEAVQRWNLVISLMLRA